MTSPRLGLEERGVGRAKRRTGNEHRCLGCDTHVSAEFARVFGDNDDTIYACLNCSTLSALRDGQAVEPR